MAELALRTVCSLAVVLGLLLLLTRLAGRRYRGRSGAVRVVQRQALSKGSAVTVVEIGSRLLVLGVTEQQVQVLAELEPGELDARGEDTPEGEVLALPGGRRTPTRTKPAAAPRGTRAARPLTSLPGGDFATQLLEQVGEQPTEVAAPARARHRAAPERPAAATSGPLAGSLLSPQTWRQTWQSLGRRAS